MNIYTSQKIKQLNKILSDCRRMTIVMHDYPDPDSIASAMLLSYLLKQKYNIISKIVYGGQVLRAENKAMIRLLHIKMFHISSIRWNKINYVALIDTQKGFTNHSLPKSIQPLIVFDHHPPLNVDSITFTDIRDNYGATVTILYEYLKESNIKLTSALSTAISYAISSETQDLGRDVSIEDIDTYTSVYPNANKNILSRIIHPKLSHEFYEILNSALQKAQIYKNIIHVHLNDIISPEFVSQIADLFLQHERITWTMVTGRIKNKLYVSLRSTNTKRNIGKMLQNIIGRTGFAGGHQMIAGGRIDLENPNEKDWTRTESLMVTRFLKKLQNNELVKWKSLIDKQIHTFNK